MWKQIFNPIEKFLQDRERSGGPLLTNFLDLPVRKNFMRDRTYPVIQSLEISLVNICNTPYRRPLRYLILCLSGWASLVLSMIVIRTSAVYQAYQNLYYSTLKSLILGTLQPSYWLLPKKAFWWYCGNWWVCIGMAKVARQDSVTWCMLIPG